MSESTSRDNATTELILVGHRLTTITTNISINTITGKRGSHQCKKDNKLNVTKAVDEPNPGLDSSFGDNGTTELTLTVDGAIKTTTLSLILKKRLSLKLLM